MAEPTEKSSPEKSAPEKSAAPAERKCAVKDCKRPYRAKGYCVTHYKMWRRGEMEKHPARYKICSKEACRKPAARWGLCAEHYQPAQGETPAPAA